MGAEEEEGVSAVSTAPVEGWLDLEVELVGWTGEAKAAAATTTRRIDGCMVVAEETWR